jgi:3-phosphoshikimate 1-carboxyvinyltransferase
MHDLTSKPIRAAAKPPFQVKKLAAPFTAQITLPGSKSIALRQLAIAALCSGTTHLTGIPDCDDTAAMLDCIQALGAKVALTAEAIVVTGPIDLSDKTVQLDARMSGASTRLLIGLAALRRGVTVIDGHPSLRARTNKPLLDLLSAQGCSIESDNGCLPARISGPIKTAKHLSIDGSLSSQYITALLIAAPGYLNEAKQVIEIQGELVSRPYIDITINEMRKRGVQVEWLNDQLLEITPGPYQAGSVTVEGDATAATYFAALATLHKSNVTLTNLGHNSCQGDYGFLRVMEQLGAEVTRGDETHISGPENIKPLPKIDMQSMPDAALTLIAMAPLLTKPIQITGLSSLHHKECDRLECPAKELALMGVELSTTEDSINISPANPATLKPHTLTTYHDHRMAMAFSLLGSMSGTLKVDDKNVVDKTYPRYWEHYATLVDDLG